jgi:hypothetical protein
VMWEPSCFLSVTWCGGVLYWLEVQDFGVLFLLFVFFLPHVAPEGKYSVWSAEGLPNTFGGSMWSWPAGSGIGVVTCFLSVLWHEEAFHRLGSQGARVSSLPCASSLPHVSPVWSL